MTLVDEGMVKTKLNVLRIVFGSLFYTITGFVGVVCGLAFYGIADIVVRFYRLPWREEK
jgi:hypothetical protein